MAPGRIAYLQYTNPGGYPPLEHSSRVLADAGWRVLFLGTRAAGANALTFPSHPNIAVKQLQYCSPGMRQKAHYIFYSLWVLAQIAAFRPRWIYASDPLSTPIALALSYLPGIRVIYHEHDSPSVQTGPAAIAACRRALARRADTCVLPNQHRLEYFRLAIGETHALCVWNCPRKDEIAPPRNGDKGGDKGSDLWLVYHGSIVPDRFPLAIVNALADLPDIVKLRIIGYETLGSRGYVDAIRATARELEIADRVEVLEPMPRFKLLEHVKRSDVGLAFVPMTPTDVNLRWMVGASNKAFDYLACGLPLLVSDLPAWKDLYVNPGYGLACVPDDPQSVGRALKSFLADRDEMRAMGEKGRQRIARDWNYETEFAKVSARLTEAGA